MNARVLFRFLFTALTALAWAAGGVAGERPLRVTSRAGDRTALLYWESERGDHPATYRVLRAGQRAGPYKPVADRLKFPAFADLEVTNGATYFYVVASVPGPGESERSETAAVTPLPFLDDDAFLDFVQHAHFAYFWYGANPKNGLVPDRIPGSAPCSIAAVGFGLSAVVVGVDRGWVTREAGLQRVKATLRTFLVSPQGTNRSGMIGNRGWFYHFLDLHTAERYTRFNTELSSIDTALFLAGALEARQFFDADSAAEREVRNMVDALYGRVDWHWMATDGELLSMGWLPESGFLKSRWTGYNEAMILYVLGLGAETGPLPASSWDRWTSNYRWETHYGQTYVPFPPLFGHQYSQCWLDLRHTADAFMRSKGLTCFENSRRAVLAQRAYCMENPRRHTGYSDVGWGITACDGPGGYAARGAPPAENDDGTLAPTAVGGSIVFAPEYVLPTMRHFYDRHRARLWTAVGFRDGFNLKARWWAPDTLGIDQGPIVLMIENQRTGRIWQRFMSHPGVIRGLKRAGFEPVAERK